MAQRYVHPIQSTFDDSGLASAGDKLNFYESGTSTRKDTFADSALTSANANPVVADSAGRFPDIFLESGDYKVVLTDAADVETWTADPVAGAVGSSGVVDEKTGAYTVTIDDATKIIACDASGGAFTVTLLAAATAGDGFEITVKKTDASANAVTVDANGAETIDGETTYSLSGEGESVTLRSDGANWRGLSELLSDLERAEAETGTATIRRRWTAERVAQAILGLSPLPRSYLAGLTLSNDTDAAHDINITAGAARNAANDGNLALASEQTKQIDASWATGNDAGGLSSSLTVANTTWYHVHLVLISGTVEVGFDTSAVAANLITDHSATKYRRIGAVLTDGSANIVAFTQFGDLFQWTTPPLDLDKSDLTTSSFSIALSTPLGVKTMARMNLFVTHGTLADVYVRSLDQTDSAPSATAAPLATGAGSPTNATPMGGIIEVLTNTSSQVAARSDASSTTLRLATIGYIDRRGKDD